MTPRKDDAGKVQMRLLPWAALREVARVMTWAVTGRLQTREYEDKDGVTKKSRSSGPTGR